MKVHSLNKFWRSASQTIENYTDKHTTEKKPQELHMQHKNLKNFICSTKCYMTANTKQLVSSSKFVPPPAKNSLLSEQIPSQEQKNHSSNSSANEAARMRSMHCNHLIPIPWLTHNFIETYAYKELPHYHWLLQAGQIPHPLPQSKEHLKNPQIRKQITRLLHTPNAVPHHSHPKKEETLYKLQIQNWNFEVGKLPHAWNMSRNKSRSCSRLARVCIQERATTKAWQRDNHKPEKQRNRSSEKSLPEIQKGKKMGRYPPRKLSMWSFRLLLSPLLLWSPVRFFFSSDHLTQDRTDGFFSLDSLSLLLCCTAIGERNPR